MASVFQKIRKLFLNNYSLDYHIKVLNYKIDSLSLSNHIERLREKTIYSTISGVSSKKYCEHEIIVSLTSFGERIHTVHLAIESIMQGTVKPNRIILWLAENEFKGKRLPHTLYLQQNRGLEIEYYKDVKSYKKLIPSLKKYPESIIITIDDDLMYEYDIIERLINTHIDNPNTICACRMHRIKLDVNKQPLNYFKWEFCTNNEIISPLNFPTTGGGTLYPPNSFDDEVFNSDIFTKICPNADDIWFYSMALRKGSKTIWVKNNKPTGYYRQIPTTGITLSKTNTCVTGGICGNDLQFRKVIEHYKLQNIFSQLQSIE